MANANLRLLCYRILLGRSQDVPVLKGLLQDHRPLRGKLRECADRSRLFNRSSGGAQDKRIAKDLRAMIVDQISDIDNA